MQTLGKMVNALYEQTQENKILSSEDNTVEKNLPRIKSFIYYIFMCVCVCMFMYVCWGAYMNT